MNNQEVIEILKKLNQVGFCSYDEKMEHIWIHEMARHQIADRLEERDKRVKAVNSIYHGLPKLIFLNSFYEKYHKAFHLLPREESISRNTFYCDSSVVKTENYPFKGPSKPGAGAGTRARKRTGRGTRAGGVTSGSRMPTSSYFSRPYYFVDHYNYFPFLFSHHYSFAR